MRLRRNGLPCDVVERTDTSKKRGHSLTVSLLLLLPQKNKQRKGRRAHAASEGLGKSETGRGRRTKCAAQITEDAVV